MNSNELELIMLGAKLASISERGAKAMVMEEFEECPEMWDTLRTIIDSAKKLQKLQVKTFYFDKGWKVYNKLKACSQDEQATFYEKYVAKSLLNDGHPSTFGYTVTVNDFYLQHFINILARY